MSAATPVQYQGPAFHSDSMVPRFMASRIRMIVWMSARTPAFRTQHETSLVRIIGMHNDLHMIHADHLWNTCSFSCDVPVKIVMKLTFEANTLWIVGISVIPHNSESFFYRELTEPLTSRKAA